MTKAKNTPAKATTDEKNLPATINFDDDAGAGFEDATSNAYAIPFLRILQKLSPQADEDSEEFVPGAKPGDYFNTVSEEVYSGPLHVIPVYFRTVFNKWAPRGSGGGFKGSVSEAEGQRLLADCSKNEKNQDVLPDGNLLSDTREHYVLIKHPETGQTKPALFALSSTQIKKSKKWMAQMSEMILPSGKKAPMFSQVYELTSVTEENDQGKWKGVKIQHVGPVTKAQDYQDAKTFLQMIRSGVVEVQHPDDEVGF